MPHKKLFEATPCGLELWLSLFEPLLCDQHSGKTATRQKLASIGRHFSKR